MLDKAILIASYVYMGGGGEITTFSAPVGEFKAYEALTCLEQASEKNEVFAAMVVKNKDKADKQGKKMIAASAQCFPITAEDFAVFTSTFALSE